MIVNLWNVVYGLVLLLIIVVLGGVIAVVCQAFWRSLRSKQNAQAFARGAERGEAMAAKGDVSAVTQLNGHGPEWDAAVQRLEAEQAQGSVVERGCYLGVQRTLNGRRK